MKITILLTLIASTLLSACAGGGAAISLPIGRLGHISVGGNAGGISVGGGIGVPVGNGNIGISGSVPVPGTGPATQTPQNQ